MRPSPTELVYPDIQNQIFSQKQKSKDTDIEKKGEEKVLSGG